jgi:hypothetical protein
VLDLALLHRGIVVAAATADWSSEISATSIAATTIIKV